MKTEILVSIALLAALLTASAEEFAGIGMVIVDRQNATVPLSIGSIVSGSPAERAGIKSGWFLISVDGTNVANMPLAQTLGAVRGLAGTSVTLELADPAMTRTNIFIVKRSKLVLSKETAGQSVMALEGLPASQVLGLYETISGHEFITDSRAKAVNLPITLKLINSPPLSRAETLKMMRLAFLTQAGLVIVQLDTNRESVTYNDALPLAITIDFDGVPDATLIDLYQKLTGLELTRDASAGISRNPITLRPDAPLGRDEAVKLLEKTLLAQAGIVVKRLDEKHALLTRNVPETSH